MQRIATFFWVFLVLGLGGIRAQTVATPSLSIPAGEYTTEKSVEASSATLGAMLHYTLNGTDPAESDPILSAPFSVKHTLQLKVKAFLAGMTPSETTTGDYVITGSVAAGGNHVLGLKSDGTVWAWGLNATGQLGDGTTVLKSSPVQVKTNATTFLTGVVEIGAGQNHSVALKSDGTVWCWGTGGGSQLGNNATANSSYPVQVKLTSTTFLTGIVAISVGDNHTLALKSDGTVWAWGTNSSSQLGDGTTAAKKMAVQVLDSVGGISGVAEIAAGGSHSLFVKTNGEVWSVGLNSSSQLGDNTTTLRNKAVQVLQAVGVPLTGVAYAAAGANHSLAIKTDGTVVAWGSNAQGQLGINSTTTSKMAVAVSGLTDVIDLVGGGAHSMAMKSDGSIWSFGFNYTGALGDGTSTRRLTPVRAGGATLGLRMAAKNNLTVVEKTDGALVSFGENVSGVFGNGTLGYAMTVAQVPSLAGITQVAAGGNQTMTLKSDGTVWTFGDNENSNLGDGTSTASGIPVRATPSSGVLDQVTQIAAGLNHQVALKGNGDVFAWGLNSNGQVGDNSTTLRARPVQVKTNATTFLTGVTAISAGDTHTVALKNDNTVWSWGLNSSGQLGDGTATKRLIATQMLASAGVPFSGATAIAAGGTHTLILKSDGTVWAVGGNANGRLGNNTTTNSSYPVQVKIDAVNFLTGVASIAAGQSHSFALKTDGTLWGWGLNSSKQLGDGTTTQRLIATVVPGAHVWTKVKAGANHTIAVRNDQTVWSFGGNTSGQLANNTLTNQGSPVQMRTASAMMGSVLEGAGGTAHSILLKTDGTVWTAGSNSRGQLGLGTRGFDPVGVTITTPRLVDGDDADGDGIPTYQERMDGTNADLADTDWDGLTDFYENNTSHTSAILADTDGDGVKDGDEIVRGTDPLNGTSINGAVFVDAISGNDANSGFVLAAPKRSIRGGLLAAISGDIVQVEPGTYSENLISTDIRSLKLKPNGTVRITVP